MTGRLADADELLHTCTSPLLCCCRPRPPPVWVVSQELAGNSTQPTLHTRRIQVHALTCVEPSGGVPAVPPLPRAGRVLGRRGRGASRCTAPACCPRTSAGSPAACRGQHQPRARPNVL